MEIHPPAGPVHTLKDFLIHLSMIVLGILIAVGLEQLVESRHHAHLVEEATANITDEIRDNEKEISGTLSTYPTTEEQLGKFLSTIKDLRAHKKLKNFSLTLDVHLSTLSTVSRNAAEAAGALGYMRYKEVKRLTGVYELQQQFLHIQENLLQSATVTLAGVQGAGPEKASDAELDSLIQRAQIYQGNLTVAKSIGTALKKEYAKALEPER